MLKRGGRDAEEEMGLGTSRAIVIFTGKEKVEAAGKGTVGHMVERVKDGKMMSSWVGEERMHMGHWWFRGPELLQGVGVSLYSHASSVSVGIRRRRKV